MGVSRDKNGRKTKIKHSNAVTVLICTSVVYYLFDDQRHYLYLLITIYICSSLFTSVRHYLHLFVTFEIRSSLFEKVSSLFDLRFLTPPIK